MGRLDEVGFLTLLCLRFLWGITRKMRFVGLERREIWAGDKDL